MSLLRAVLCGNPNVGKSTVFNALTGLKQHTGNWSGKTVESARGTFFIGSDRWEITDLPGAYSLLSGSPEEIVASNHLTFESFDIAIVVCDATCLERNLNLALQLMQACPKVVLCLNMMDEAHRKGIEIDASRLEKLLGVPVAEVSARRRKGLDKLKACISKEVYGCDNSTPIQLRYDQTIENALDLLASSVQSNRFHAVRALLGSENLFERLGVSTELHEKAWSYLHENGYTRERVTASIISTSYEFADHLCKQTVRTKKSISQNNRQQRFDRFLGQKWAALLLSLGMLAGVLYITIAGANIPSAWLSMQFRALEKPLLKWLESIALPVWIIDLLVSGVYRVTTWVVSVMLPPMAIFFPLFTFMEDVGLLPRIAFHLDKCFHRCHSCGKQSLCMCMGLGCNAVGVTGCRIIQSPRERLIAILTNALTPCNGRFPTLIALITMFFSSGTSAFEGALFLTGLMVLSFFATLLTSSFLSKTILKGVPSAFALELPPFRKPKITELVVRSVLDRTLCVLGRAITIAAPAGLVVWLLANIPLQSRSLLQHLSLWLDPAGKLLGMDGVILLAFILGFPANEIVLPLMMMIYLDAGSITELTNLEDLRKLFLQNGWTFWTALSTTLFSLFHWPCSTTMMTIWKETQSIKWTSISFMVPASVGIMLCLLLRAVRLFFF